MSDRLPAALRAYRLFSAAMTPLTPLLLARRLEHGKEHRLRLPERRGVASAARPRGPAGLAARRQRRRTDQRAAADRAHPRARDRRAGDLGHRHLRRPRRAAAAARRHPPIRAARRAAFRAPLPRSLAAGSRAVRGIGSVAEHHDRDLAARRADDPGQRTAVGELVPPLAPFCRRPSATCCGGSTCAWRARRPTPSGSSELGAPHVITTGDLKLDGPAPPADRGKLAALQTRDRAAGR